jgi:hypothetical protein
MKKEESFNYCVGRPWGKEECGNDEELSIYSSFGEVIWGTMKDAKAFKNYVEKKTGKKEFIYKLVKIEEGK